MTAELGLFFLILAFFTALLQGAMLAPVPALKRLLQPTLLPASWLQALCVTLAFAILMTLRLDSDFSVTNVAANSNRALPILYKIAGTWGNHEGSMLLWVLVLSLFGATLALRPLPPGQDVLKTLAIGVQSSLSAGFLLFILFTSNPFARQFPPPPDGDALNPLLQDIALSMHPPLLYLGYVGFSMVFSLAVAALLQGRMERSWADIAHPWILASWSALTLGIGLGSWWAYRVLGWGGFWFWDPVENASLMPWLAGTALLHSNLVLKKRGILKTWVLLLAIVTFAMSLLGTFLVRSGVLISVHSFASDPARGYFILGYIVAVVGGALALFAWRADDATTEPAANDEVTPVSREGLIVLNNMFLLTACATVMLGTLYPMLMEWLYSDKITVGAPYFNLTFLPLVAFPLLFAGLVPFMPWQKADIRHALKQVKSAGWACLAAIFLVLSAAKTDAVVSACGIALSLWLAVCSVQWVMKRGTRGANLAVFLGHMGAALVVAGVTGAGIWKQEAERAISVGDTIEIAGYKLIYEMQTYEDTANYHAKLGRLRVTTMDGDYITTLKPEYRTYTIRKSATSKAAIHATPIYDLYAVIGDSSPDGKKTAARIYYNPLINLMWFGFVIMAAGGVAGIVRRKA